jgi:predicted amidophosphoribosyltransferase
MPKRFDVTITIPLHLHNARTFEAAEKSAKCFARYLTNELKGLQVYDESEQPTITIREVQTP